MNTLKKYNPTYTIGFSIMFPFLSYLSDMVNKNIHSLKYSLPLFYGFLGFTFQLRSESDAHRAVEQFDRIVSTNASFFDYAIQKLVNFRSEGTEIYYDLLSYSISFFTNDWRFFFLINGVIAGIIIYNIVKLIYETYPNIKWSSLLIISLMIMPIWILNGRFWLGAMFFILFALKYLKTDQLKYLMISFLCILIHQGLAFAPILLFIFKYVKNYEKIILIFYGLSFLYLGSGADLIGDGLDYFSGDIEKKIHEYSSIDVESSKKETIASRSANFFIYSFQDQVYQLVVLISLFFIFILKKDRIDSYSYVLILLTILLFSFYNFTSSIASLGGRYGQIASTIGLVPMILNFNLISVKILKYSLIAGLAFVFIINLRMEAEQMNAFFPIWGYIQAFIDVPEIAVLEILK